MRPASREVTCSFRGSVRRAAPSLASGAPPRRSRRPRGVPRRTVSRDLRSERSSPGVGFLFRVPSSRCRPYPMSAPVRMCVRERSRLRDPPLLSFSFLEHNDSGCPVSPDAAREQPRGGWGLPGPHRCRPQGWFPLDGSDCARECTDPVKSPPLFQGTPKLRGLVPCRSRSWNLPSELSPLEEPFPLSRAVASLRVRVRRPPARSRRALHVTFTAAPTLCHGSPRGFTGRTGQDDGSPSR